MNDVVKFIGTRAVDSTNFGFQAWGVVLFGLQVLK